MDAVSQVVSGGGKLLWEFPNKLGPFKLRVGHCFLMAVTMVIIEDLSKLFVRHSGRDTT